MSNLQRLEETIRAMQELAAIERRGHVTGSYRGETAAYRKADALWKRTKPGFKRGLKIA